MSTTARVARQRGADRRSGGFSLIEMMITVTIAVIIGMGLYFIFTSQQRASRSQKTYNDLQTNCSFAMDTIKSDLLLAGYRARTPLEPISGAAANSITFEYWDDRASVDPPYDDVTQWTNHTQITYSLNGTDLNKTIRRWHTSGTGLYDVPLTFTLAKNVPSLGFEYFKEDNVPWTSGEPKSLIRTVRISLQCRAAQPDAIQVDPSRPGGAPKYQSIALTAEVRPRNIAIAENPEDKTPPAPPLTAAGATLKVWDEGQCGCLQLKWTSNTDSDIAGYTVYYGLVAGTYIGRARAVHTAGETRLQLRNLTATNVPYYITLAAYDKSGNQSALSTTVAYANPTPSVRTESDPGNDTTITPLAPPPPGSPSIATPADNQLQVSWVNTYSDCTVTPVYGFRVYRDTVADFTPQGAAAGYGNCVADEGTLGPTATSFLDTGADTAPGYLTGCVPYYYKIAVVNCDPSQLTAFTDGDPATPSTYTAAQFASVTGTPTDGSRTSPPVLTSTPGFRRISLDVENPSHTDYPDFMHTRVYFSTVGPPTLTENRDAEGFNVVDGGDLIPDRGGIIPEGGSAPTINFDDENNETPPGGLGAPQLQPDQTYYFLAVAYDRCKNHSVDTASARSTAEQCNDCLEAQGCRDFPPVPSNVRVTQGCDGAPVRLEWDYAAANYTSNPDFQGFRIVRCQGAGCVPADPILGGGTATVLSGTYLSAPLTYVDDSVVDGEIYNYRVYAGDCYYQRWLEGLLTDDELSNNDPANNASSADVSNVALGFFDRARVVGDLETVLTADIGVSDRTIPVASTAGWALKRLQINTEVIACDTVLPTSFADCTRGMDGSMPISHRAGTPVRSYPHAPSRAAVTGDLAATPQTFLHNTIIVGARNTSAGGLTLRELTSSWDDPASWFTELLYDNSVTAFSETLPPFTHGSSGSIATLTAITVPPLVDNVPLKMTFRKADGTVDPSIDVRGDSFDLNWLYTNNATGITTCTREWRPPSTAGIVGPLGPTIMGTTQSTPTFGTVAWPVPGVANNPLDAIVSPSDAWNQVSTFVHDTSGTGVASVRLYYTTTDPSNDVAPAVSGAYPGCYPYTMVEMSNTAGTELWEAQWPLEPGHPRDLNDKNVWYFIVAVDNEGNFDREPEVAQGAFQYYQQPVDPCLSTPEAPQVTGMVSSSSVTLDWSSSWYGDPPVYHNTNYTACSDLAGFRVYQQISGGAWFEVPGSPLPPTQQSYTRGFTTAVATLSASIDAVATTIPVGSTAGFRGSGRIRIGSEIIAYAGITADSFVGCARGRDATLPVVHPAGEAVTQDLLALETNSFFVRAFDTCEPAAKYSDSMTYTEGSCNPRCDLDVDPSGWSIRPGDTFQVRIQACQKQGNGTQDTIYVHVCSSVEGDDFPLTEAGDSGDFSGTVRTRLGTSAGGGNAELMVAETDTILVGGFASVPSTWSPIDTCSGKTYGCGGQQVVTVAPTTGDICVDDHFPAAPLSPSPALVSGDSCSGGGTTRMTLSWTPVPPITECTNLYYRGYYCEPASGLSTCTPTIPISGFFTSAGANCSGTTCRSNIIDFAPAKISGPSKVYKFAVTAVCEISTCPSGVQTWESPASAIAGDACSP